MAIVRFTCPECDEVFQNHAAPAPGKKVRCPACKHAFVPPADDDEEEDDDEDQPRREGEDAGQKNRRQKTPPRRRGRR